MLQLDWNTTLDLIREGLPPAQFLNWLKPVRLVSYNDESVVLGVPSRFHEQWLRSHYAQTITQAIKNQVGADLQLEFQIVVGEQTPLVETIKSVTPTDCALSPWPNLHGIEPALVEVKQAPSPAPNIPLFNSPFLESEYNSVAFRCASLFAEGKEALINPLIILGSIGTGKTHLLAEIGRKIHERNPRLLIRYTTFEAFTAEMVQSFKDGSILSFKRKYRDQNYCLLLDDIQGLSKKLRTQEELLYILNDIVGRDGRVAFTTTVPPHLLEDFIEPLRSRLLSGVIAEITSPSFEERVELLKRKSEEVGIAVEPGVLRSIAGQITSDIRELMGTLLRIHLHSKIEQKPLTTQFLVDHGMCRQEQYFSSEIKMDDILRLIEHNFGITRTELMSKSRKSRVAWARQVAMYLARLYTSLSLDVIGKTFDRDHATVVHAFQKVNDTIQNQPTKSYEVEFLKKRLAARRKETPPCTEYYLPSTS